MIHRQAIAAIFGACLAQAAACPADAASLQVEPVTLDADAAE
jgi:hypothetical protein